MALAAIRGEKTLAELAEAFAEREVKGEIVVLIDRGSVEKADEATVTDALRLAMADLSVKDAAATVAAQFGLPRREVYQMALKLGAE